MHTYVNKALEGYKNYSITVKNGCKGCGGEWRSCDFHEGQCSKCKRCLECCGHDNVMYSCAWKYEREYGGSDPVTTAKRIRHNTHVARGIKGYYTRLDKGDHGRAW